VTAPAAAPPHAELGEWERRIRPAARELYKLAADQEGCNFPEALIAILGHVAAELGSSYALIAERSGSWEADLIRQLVHDDWLPPRGLIRRTKLTPDQITRIWIRWDEGLTYRAIAAEFGVACSTVSDILNGRTWLKHSQAEGWLPKSWDRR
jgi:hypothetical protein